MRLFVAIIALLLAGVALLFFAGALGRHFVAVGPDWLAATSNFGTAAIGNHAPRAEELNVDDDGFGEMRRCSLGRLDLCSEGWPSDR